LITDLIRTKRRMGDRLGRPVKAVTAAAKILRPTIEDAPRDEHWHDEAWAFRDTTGELRFAELWLANSLSRVRLIAAQRPEPGSEPEPITSGPAADLVAELAGGPGGQSALLRSFAPQLFIPGVGYLVGEPSLQGANRWGVYSADQIRLSVRSDPSGLRTYDLQEGPNAKDWRQLPPGTLPIKVWRPHPRFSWQPDSPVRAALPILRELALLTQHVDASAKSRLAGAGVLAMDSNIQFPGGWEKWIEDFLDVVNRPIKDRASAAAHAPFPMRIPLGKGDKIADKMMHLMFSTPFDEQALKLRDEAIDRLATALDMPKRALLGEQENHWGKWATTEEGIQLHVAPNMELICDGLTRGYLDPAMAVTKNRRDGSLFERGTTGRPIDVLPIEAPPGDFIIWYDASSLATRPDKSGDTREAYDRWEASGDDLRDESGISDAQPPKAGEFERRAWITMLEKGDAQMQHLAVVKLGLATEDEIPKAPAPPGQPAPPDEEPEDEEPALPAPRALPTTREEPAPDEEPAAAGVLAPAAAVVAACDGLVFRALEKAGNRLRQAHRRNLNGATDCTAALMHTCLNATAIRTMDQLLEGAWDRVPEIAAMLNEPPDELRHVLDAYTRVLIRTQQPHSWDRLACALGCDAELPCPEAVPA
jgi:hypothetical protein